MTVTAQERADMLEIALRLIDNLLEHPLNDIARRNAQEIIRHALRETTSQ